MEKLISPIETIQWIDPNTLTANNYNPNFVFTNEMRLLELSLKKNGWIQPILATGKLEIIDGFHRHLISKRNNWLVPVAILDISETEQKLLTIRINRAKGTHIAVKMSDLIRDLINQGIEETYIAEQIGATIDEVELLKKEDVFKKFDFEGYNFSKSWIPTKKK